MNFDEYTKIIKETVLNEYPAYFQKKIIKRLSEKKEIHIDRRQKNDKNLLDVTMCNSIKDTMKYILDNHDRTIKEIEMFEYEKGYRYCSIFAISNYDDALLEKLKGVKIKKFSDDITEYDNVNFTVMNPTYKIMDDKTIFKFSIYLKNRDDENKRIKYPILAIIHKDIDALEIRLDTVTFAYKNKESFYKDNINSVLAWLRSMLCFNEDSRVMIDNINFESIVRYMKKEKVDDVTIVALKMRRDGMMAYLDSASNEELMIPILGELKKLLYKEKDKFEKSDDTKEIKKILDDFMEEIEETSSLPSVKILWEEKKIKILLTHGYKNEEYTLFKYSDELGDEEMMNYVTNYIIGCKKELDKKCDN
ncbi:hypothetical protein [Clostridium ihumii]|uniref:hypothetical protein n=1 Tax=Clostridium ihumii TaxID=1470356 RepID=UPI00058AD3DA|nr:hypothetical protein [Clostridium ihumii]